jgi:hypothetical protein
MQGLDFKAEVDRRCAKVLTSISARMGFVPAGIQQTLMKLKVLKAPGDPAYDAVRASTGHLRYRRVSPSRTDNRSDSPPKKTQGQDKGRDRENTGSKMLFTKSMSNSTFGEQIDSILAAYSSGRSREKAPDDIDDESDTGDATAAHVADDDDELDGFFTDSQNGENIGTSLSPESRKRLETRISTSDIGGLENSKQIFWSKWDARLTLMGKGEVSPALNKFLLILHIEIFGVKGNIFL